MNTILAAVVSKSHSLSGGLTYFCAHLASFVPPPLCGKLKIHYYENYFSSNPFRVKFFFRKKKLISQNFCDNMVAVKFTQCGNFRIFLPPRFYLKLPFSQFQRL